ncbi:MAG: hypothetical protein KA116_07825 [Proteobacteria bacterium]|nr:hypothetical protein [Pseudomonadota bacterium]
MRSSLRIMAIIGIYLGAQLSWAIDEKPCAESLKEFRLNTLFKEGADAYAKSLNLNLSVSDVKVLPREGKDKIPLLGKTVKSVLISIKDVDGKTIAYSRVNIEAVKKFGITRGYRATFVKSETFGEANKGQYLSLATYKKFFEMHPEITELYGELVLDNARAFAKAYDNIPKTSDENKAFEDAIKETHMYRSMSRFGFSQLDLKKSSMKPGVLQKYNVVVVLKCP